jgi:hypothetical protein
MTKILSYFLSATLVVLCLTIFGYWFWHNGIILFIDTFIDPYLNTNHADVSLVEDFDTRNFSRKKLRILNFSNFDYVRPSQGILTPFDGYGGYRANNVGINLPSETEVTWCVIDGYNPFDRSQSLEEIVDKSEKYKQVINLRHLVYLPNRKMRLCLIFTADEKWVAELRPTTEGPYEIDGRYQKYTTPPATSAFASPALSSSKN